MSKLSSVHADRTLSRTGLWATGPQQLTLPIEARGLSEVLIASGRLQLTPDYDVLAWLCERWMKRPTESGWMRPTLYEIGSDLYQGPPSGKDYRTLRDALLRLAHVSLTLRGIDGITGQPNPDAFIEGEGLLVWTGQRSARLDGSYRPGIRLAGWLRQELDRGAPVRLHWRTLRAFDEKQTLAKRLWVYLAAEQWKRTSATHESTWVACGDRLEAALGMAYERPRDARAALKRACLAVRKVDARYAAGNLEIVKVGRGWHLRAERPTWDTWQTLRAEHEAARKAIKDSLNP